MSTNFWQNILGGLKTIIAGIENELEKGAHQLWNIITAIFKAEEMQLMADIKPMIRQIAVNLQNTQPGLDAKTFIPILVAAAIPVLEAEGVVLLHTAISAISATVAHEMGIPNTPGNAGMIIKKPEA